MYIGSKHAKLLFIGPEDTTTIHSFTTNSKVCTELEGEWCVLYSDQVISGTLNFTTSTFF